VSSLRPSRLLRPGGRLLDPELLTQSPDRPVKIVLVGHPEFDLPDEPCPLYVTPYDPLRWGERNGGSWGFWRS
jgi:hypothetical protein